MKRAFILTVCITIFSVGVVFAGAPDISGDWSGTFVAIYSDGTVVGPLPGDATINQNEDYPNLFSGYFTFKLNGDIFTRDFTGYISPDKRMTINLTEGPSSVGIAEAHFTGKTIKGVLRDFTDTTTTFFTATKK